MSHPPRQNEAQGEDRSATSEGQQSRTSDRDVNEFPRDTNRHSPAGDRRPSKCGINGDLLARDVGKPAGSRSGHRFPDDWRRRLAEEPIEFAIAAHNNALAVEYSDGPVG